ENGGPLSTHQNGRTRCTLHSLLPIELKLHSFVVRKTACFHGLTNCSRSDSICSSSTDSIAVWYSTGCVRIWRTSAALFSCMTGRGRNTAAQFVDSQNGGY